MNQTPNRIYTCRIYSVDYLIIVEFYYFSRPRPVVELYLNFNEAVSRVEKLGYSLFDYGSSEDEYLFRKVRPVRRTRKARQLEGLERIEVKRNASK